MRSIQRAVILAAAALAVLAPAVGLVLPAAAAAGTTSSPALITTMTSLTASSASITRDSWVTFTAKVSAASGTPTGSVTFTDQSNGSILDTAALTTGTVSFSTAALAPGSRSIVAHYTGSGTYAASTSAALGIPVAQAGSLATAYQVDPSHDGHQAGGTLNVSSLAKKWSVTLGGTGGSAVEAGDVSYPIVAGGRVFVTVENSQSYGTVLDALNAGTGTTDWSVGLGGLYGFSALTYDGRHVFALNYNGVLTAFVASTGHELWSAQMPGQYAFTAPPTAYDGVVYVSGAGSGGTVYAVSEADGVVRWTGSVQNGDKSSPAVDNSGAYVSYAVQQDYRFTLRGHLVWNYSAGGEGGGGSTAVLHGSSVYARGAHDPPLILSKSSGTLTGSFAADTAPAFDNTNMYTLQSGNLLAVAPSGSPNRWVFGNGTLVTAPVVSGGVVFVGGSDGTVYGVSASSGTQVWTGTAGSTILGPDEQNADVLIGMTIGGGLLVVPAGNVLTAFGT
jgi:outer membrane protein assembly factor BamB